VSALTLPPRQQPPEYPVFDVSVSEIRVRSPHDLLTTFFAIFEGIFTRIPHSDRNPCQLLAGFKGVFFGSITSKIIKLIIILYILSFTVHLDKALPIELREHAERKMHGNYRFMWTAAIYRRFRFVLDLLVE
jgi:hypothetical protein